MTPGGGLPLLVTVAVDAIELGHPVALDRDVVCQGQVVFTGGSSLDIRMELLQVWLTAVCVVDHTVCFAMRAVWFSGFESGFMPHLQQGVK
jgi:acyl-CoA hydrolase